MGHEQEYPVDEYGAEMGENARVWRAYLDEADEYDSEMVEGFRDTTDVLLIFAGLFSAVVSTFVTQSSQALGPDYLKITASLMTDLVKLQRAVASGADVSQIPPSSLSFIDDNTTKPLDRWVNGLWLTSLTLSLIAALVAVLAKQWLIHYVSALSGTPRRRVLVHHFRFVGLEKWRVSTIIAALPVLLHLSLFMFLGGLVLFVWQQDLSMAAVILAFTLLTSVFYLLSNILAAFIADCAYKTPLSRILRYLRHTPIFGMSSTWQAQSYRDAEVKAAEASQDQMLLRALSWLHSSSYSPRNNNIARFAFAGLPFGLVPNMDRHLQDEMRRNFFSLLDDNSEAEITTNIHSEFTLRSGLILQFGIDTDVMLRLDPRTIKAFQLFTAHLSKDRRIASIANDLTYLSTLSGLVSNKASLTPAVWRALFEQNVRPLHVVHGDVAGRFITVLLPILKFATNDMYHTSTSGTNWSLPPATNLLQLCNADYRMFRIILDFMCRTLLSQGSLHMASIRKALDDPAGALSDPPIILHIILSVIDSLHSELAATATGIEEYARDLLSTCEATLFSSPAIPPDLWCQSAFVTALHRCREVQLAFQISGSGVTSRLLRHFTSQTPSLAVIVLYLLDVLEHPWPLARKSDLQTTKPVLALMRHLFGARDPEAFRCLLEHDGLSVFRRCFPIDFNVGEIFSHISHCCFDYVSFVLSQRLCDEELQRHLDMITQPDNLAFLMFIAGRQEMIEPIYSLRPDPSYWVAAADVLVEELRRDEASGRASVFSYIHVARILCQVKLDHYVLYSYATPGRGWLSRFRRFSEDGVSVDDVMYGPFAVYTTCEAILSA